MFLLTDDGTSSTARYGADLHLHGSSPVTFKLAGHPHYYRVSAGGRASRARTEEHVFGSSSSTGGTGRSKDEV